MKKLIFSLSMIAMILMMAFTSSDDAILQKLGVDKGNADYSIEGYFLRNSFYIPRAKFLKDIVNGDKTGAAMELASYVKGYVMSDAFKAKYQELRMANMPTSEPERMPASMIQQMKEGLKTMEDMTNDTYMMSMYSKEDKEQMQKSLEEMRASIREAEDPHPNKTKWLKNYPEDPKEMIKARLNEYLQLVESVDFNAQLTTNQYNKQIFVNPEYERKNSRWKACYRAGKEVNTQMKVFVQNWLKELN